MNKYQSYKPSGVEWIGEIPKDWRISKMKFENEIVSSSIDKKEYDGYEKHLIIHYNDVIKNPKIYKENIVEFGYCTNSQFQNFKVSKGDIILTKDSMDINNICDSSIIVEELENCVFGYHLYKIQSKKDKLNSSFLYYFFNNKSLKNYFLVNSNGTTIIGVSKSLLENTYLVLPSIQEQHQIVQFLDEKTELIDKLISTKEKKITLLNEQRTSIINEVVTKGLNPNVKMKDSGVEWIGEIPEHWKSCNLRYVLELLTDFESNGSFSSVKENVKVDDEGEVWYVRMTDLENNNIRNEKCKYCDLDTYNFLHKTKVFGGELLITKRGEIGKVYLFPHNCGLSTLGPNSYLLRLKKIVNSHFLYFFYISDIGQTTLKLLDNSTTIGSLYKDDIKSSSVIVPPTDEQLRIVEHLVIKTKEIDDMVQLEQKKIDLLKEYRQSLISEVVTGKIKVTTDE